MPLQDQALLALWFRRGAGIEYRTEGLDRVGVERRDSIPNSLVKDALQVALRQGGTLQILVRANLLGNTKSLFVGHGFHLPHSESLSGGSVVP